MGLARDSLDRLYVHDVLRSDWPAPINQPIRAKRGIVAFSLNANHTYTTPSEMNNNVTKI